MLVPMELARIMISEVSDQQVIYLRAVDGERMLPILIGLFEATSIDRRVKKEYPQRPLTHDLLKATVEALGGEIESIVINDLREHTYFAKLRIRQGGNLVEVDSRPSDAVALAVHYEPHLPIYVDSGVLDQVP
ncbi:MAG: bifunctional nuclease family protein [Planctomycetaceae bacterium]|nr:bifunctional nuclease family protein [Planctomycetaceae bacterium]